MNVTKIFFADTYSGVNYAWPGTKDNPMRPIMYKDPVTGEEHQAHYNERTLTTNEDYIKAGFEYIEKRGWCYPIEVCVPRTQNGLNGIAI